MTSELTSQWPQWLRDIDASLAVNSQYLIVGNIRDWHVLEDASGTSAPYETIEAIWECLRSSGYEILFVNDQVDGLRVAHAAAGVDDAAVAEVLGEHADAIGRVLTLTRLAAVARRVSLETSRRAAVVLDYSSRLVGDVSHLSDEERQFYSSLEKASHNAFPRYRDGVRPGPLHNPILWLLNRQNDIPSWLAASNEAVRVVSVPVPDLDERRRVAELLLPALVPDGDGAPELVDRFASQTEGMTAKGLQAVVSLALDRGFAADAIDDAIRCYQVGMLDNPWKRPYLRSRIRDGEKHLSERVLGQSHALRRALDILIRSSTGLTGAHARSSTSRPRGVLFFAGPTGVGKTELAKALAELIFGDERAYTRFDMSEFSAEHADARLIGAPPGFIGHDAGGELTNAVRQRPFSLILFDEIEKAHPRILDKFLQVLEDGRLTDGSGATVHFSETVLVFTSNLGIYVVDEAGRRTANVTLDTPREELEQRVLEAIRNHFITHLNRPELLNRLGDNIVVFQYIQPDVADQIFELLIRNVVNRIDDELDATLEIAPDVQDQLRRLSTADRQLGGRGIGSVLESVFVNPLARAIFDRGVEAGDTVVVTAIEQRDDIWHVGLR